IEFLHSPQKSLVSQREIGTDTPDFLSGLRSALRQDPDLVFLGELRDRETVEAAITIAETGHLTFATLHTNSCIQTLHRIVDVFPASQQAQVRAQLALVVEGIISQALLPKADGKGRALALEVLLPTPAIRNLIRDDKIHQIYSVMQTGQAKHGMQTMNQALLDLAKRRIISPAAALTRSRHPEELRGMIERAGSAFRSSGTHITG
ncbi:MAG: ATPase, T2SS/T4P/T4SS family, partial [Nitrospirae bacterium]|nr:ATPase, T2SS/T4P/T4SS family [Nitrospirota bacterium]